MDNNTHTPNDHHNDTEELEAEAASIIKYLEHQNALENPAAINHLPAILPLINELQSALDYSSETDAETILVHQAKALDTAFRRLLLDGDTLYEHGSKCDFQPMKYAAAFKAQEQFRRTLTTLQALQENSKRDKQTDGI